MARFIEQFFATEADKQQFLSRCRPMNGNAADETFTRHAEIFYFLGKFHA